jgi:hypothetical protein
MNMSRIIKAPKSVDVHSCLLIHCMAFKKNLEGVVLTAKASKPHNPRD